ncbi:MAG: hypothetical protein FIA95_15220 [Gemmatimonadetes bacterium]|nr:hypothetical protein [Gemmatimonadota bacterium]
MRTLRELSRGALALGLAMALAGTVPAGAQEVDARWLPWIGCWEPVGEATEADLVCVRPSDGTAAVEILRIKGTEVVAREVVRTDAQRHENVHESCKGWDEAMFSEDGRRVFLRSSYACGQGVTQEGGGILAFTSPGEWLDVRTAGMGGQSAAWAQRFQPADPALAEAAGFGDLLGDRTWSVRTARMVAGAGVDVDDVIEATRRVSPEAVKAFLAEQGSPLELSAAELVRMADAGVPDHVIDVAVAVTYPERFTLRGQGEQVAMSALDEGSLRRRWSSQGYMGMGSFYDPFYSPWSLRYGFGYGSYGYGYSPYSYGWGYNPYSYGWGYGGGYWGGYAPVVVDVDRAQPDHGRVIAGRGYSRGGSSGSASSGGYSGSGASRSPSPSSSGSSGVGSGGYSSGGSSSGGAAGGCSGARTAMPRGGGGGGL